MRCLCSLKQPGTDRGSFYLRSAQLLAERVYGGLKKRMVMPQAQINRAESELQKLTNDLQMLHLQIRAARLSLAWHSSKAGRLTVARKSKEFAKLVHLILIVMDCEWFAFNAEIRPYFDAQELATPKTAYSFFDHYLESGRTFHCAQQLYRFSRSSPPACRGGSQPAEQSTSLRFRQI
ncbi:MAG: hypothetical protein U0930_06555 [Pirellulales bacterium]